MPRESVIFGIAGVFFGVLVGWIIGSQQAGPARQIPAVPADAPQTQSQQTRTPPPLDEARVAQLKAALEKSPGNAAPRVELANLYFDHERFVDAAHWYEEALKLEPRSVNVSTGPGHRVLLHEPARRRAEAVRAIADDRAGHTKTLLNVGIVRAFGKQDLDGAAKAWERVIELAPSSPEAGTARQALASLRSGHPDTGGAQARPPDRQVVMAGLLLKLILFLVVVRLVWRFVRGVLEGAGLLQVRGASERRPRTRSGLRCLRRAFPGADGAEGIGNAILLLREMPDGVERLNHVRRAT